MKKYLITGLISILIVFCIISTMRCSRLERENISLKIEQTTTIDSIKIENQILNKELLILCQDLEIYKHKVDSLNAVKQKVIVETRYIVSDDIVECIEQLKDNLKWERY